MCFNKLRYMCCSLGKQIVLSKELTDRKSEHWIKSHHFATSTTCNLDRNISVSLSIKHTVLRAQTEFSNKKHRRVSGKGMVKALRI